MDHFQAKLKKHDLKLTPRRKAIIEIFYESDRHLTPEEVWLELQKRFNRCGFPGVYRNLESLVECGVLARIQSFDRKKHYGLCTSQEKHHHHIVCIKCGKVEVFNDCLFENTGTINGYKVISHFMQINGICSDCINK